MGADLYMKQSNEEFYFPIPKRCREIIIKYLFTKEGKQFVIDHFKSRFINLSEVINDNIKATKLRNKRSSKKIN